MGFGGETPVLLRTDRRLRSTDTFVQFIYLCDSALIRLCGFSSDPIGVWLADLGGFDESTGAVKHQ